ncbi:Translational regulator CsrA [Sporomusa silvacetica DSM 10669]|uniref:Translational regulator CsrA n=1 Tax=Sporomusa silvacetica DSM 10669 TaxID=1123289 RepID=A0ABZ3IQL0_9FIRM|nr:carbon storage regulator CsrA [Sporomusa silvacetica]OZC20493.1 carbon storage regulator [Sporomusa silvacetica DSM 10669]
MLALTRKAGERIVIDDNIVITIVDIKGENIRLAIEAPREIKIYRGELYDAIVAENRQAAVPAKDGILDVLKDIKVRKP